MSNLSEFLGGGGGGGLTPKYQEFTASGTFTPSAALIAAGGFIEVFIVGAGGGYLTTANAGSCGGAVHIKNMNLTSTTGISVTIGAGASYAKGGNSSFLGSSAGGYDITAIGGAIGHQDTNKPPSASWGAYGDITEDLGFSAGQGVFGYGAGGGITTSTNGLGGILDPRANSGQASGRQANPAGGSGYCLVKWYE